MQLYRNEGKATKYTVTMRPVLLAFLLAAPLAAQTVVPRTITFSGAPALPQPDLLTLSGLHPGDTLTQPQIEAAMNRMADTGLFADIHFSTSPGALAFQLVPQDAAHMRAVAYTNVPWYTQPELNAALQKQLPLFSGRVPVEGDMKDRVAAALEAVLKQNQSIDATVKAIGDPSGALNYSIVAPPVMVGKLLIAGALLDSAPTLIDVQSRFADAPYVTSTSEDALRKNLADAYLDLGYLDQQVDQPAHAVPRIGKQQISVDLTGTAHPGQRYNVTRLDLPPAIGSITRPELDKAVALKVGQPTSVLLVKSAQARLEYVFQDHGYLDAATTVQPAKDSAAHTIAYTFSTVPGEIYKMRNLVFSAPLSAQQQSILSQAWKLSKGSPYSGSIAAESLHASKVQLVCGGPLVLASLIPDKATHEVDVNLSCSQNQHP